MPVLCFKSCTDEPQSLSTRTDAAIDTTSNTVENSTNTNFFEKPENADFVDELLAVIIERMDSIPVEFPAIYDTLASRIPVDSVEQLIIVKKLEEQGFTIKRWERGNFAKGPRIVVVELEKEDCHCTVSKRYYTNTISDEYWDMTETISCANVAIKGNSQMAEHKTE